jgi:hypothetical protein
LLHRSAQREVPRAETAVGIDRRDPSLRRRPLHVETRIVAFGLQHQVERRSLPEPDDEVGLELVFLPVVEIWNRKSEGGVLDESLVLPFDCARALPPGDRRD